MKIRDKYAVRKINSENIVVAKTESVFNINRMLILNDIGAELFEFLNENKTYQDLLDFIINNYDVKKEQAVIDLDMFLSQLKEKNLLENENC